MTKLIVSIFLLALLPIHATQINKRLWAELEKAKHLPVSPDNPQELSWSSGIDHNNQESVDEVMAEFNKESSTQEDSISHQMSAQKKIPPTQDHPSSPSLTRYRTR